PRQPLGYGRDKKISGGRMTTVRAAAVIGAAIILCTASPNNGRAEEPAKDYPNRPVTLVVPFAPGGSTGLIARLIGQKLEQRLGKPVVVEHRPGAGGMTAVAPGAHGTADGHTPMMGSRTALGPNVHPRQSPPVRPRTG